MPHRASVSLLPRGGSRRLRIPTPLIVSGLGGAGAVLIAIFLGLRASTSVHAFVHTDVPVLLVPVVVWLIVSERYDLTLTVMFLYLGLFDGPVKLTSGSSVGTLGRDVVIYAVCLGAIARLAIRGQRVRLPATALLPLLWIAVCVVQIPNPGDASVLHAVVSLRQHLEFLPLFFIGYFYLQTEARLRGFLVLLVVVAAINGIVVVIQAHLTPAQLASWGPGYAQLELGSAQTGVARVFTINGQAFVRPPGLGGSDGGGSVLCALAIPALLALVTGGHGLKRWLVPGLCVVPVILGLAYSQDRSLIVEAAVAALAFAVLTLNSRRGLLVLSMTVLLIGGAYFLSTTVLSGGPNRYSASQISSGLSTRETSAALIPKYVRAFPLGDGLGSVGAAAGSGIGGQGAKQLDSDNEIDFLLIETGIPGAVVMIWFTLATLSRAWRIRSVTAGSLRYLLMALAAGFVSTLPLWFDSPVTAVSPLTPFIWLSAGVIAYWCRRRPNATRHDLTLLPAFGRPAV